MLCRAVRVTGEPVAVEAFSRGSQLMKPGGCPEYKRKAHGIG